MRAGCAGHLRQSDSCGQKRHHIGPASDTIRDMDLPIKDIDLSTLPPEVAAMIQGLIEITKRQDALIKELRSQFPRWKARATRPQ